MAIEINDFIYSKFNSQVQVKLSYNPQMCHPVKKIGTLNPN